MTKRVVITGIGPVTSIGIGKDELFNNLVQLKTNIVAIPAEYEKKYHFKSSYYVPMPDFKLGDHGIDSVYEKIMENTSRIAVLAADLAIKDANLSLFAEAAVILGVGIGSLGTALESYVAHNVENAATRYNRMVIPMLMPNATAAWVSILFGIKGPNYTLNAACASGTYAIGEAFQKIQNGYCRIALAGGVECLQDKTGSTMRGFDMLTALTKSTDGLPKPFSKDRSGFLFNDGAGCVLVLEELEQATARGARIYAEIDGFEANSDAHNIVQMEDSGEQIKNMLQKLISDKKIDYLNAHGTGTVANDEIEAKVIQDVFGDSAHQPYINSTKGILGHSIGASGAIEAAVTALAIKESKIHGNIIGEPMEGLNLVKESISVPVEYAVSTSYGFGGHNAGLLLKRYND